MGLDSANASLCVLVRACGLLCGGKGSGSMLACQDDGVVTPAVEGLDAGGVGGVCIGGRCFEGGVGLKVALRLASMGDGR